MQFQAPIYLGLGIEAKGDIYNKFVHDKPISIQLDPPSTQRPPLLELKQEGKQSIFTTDFYFTNIKPSDIVTPVPDTNNDDPLADQAAATNPALFDMDPTQPGEIRLHSWMLYTSQAPVLDLTNNSVRTTKDFEQAFSELNLCSEPEDESTHGRKASRSKERKANRK